MTQAGNDISITGTIPYEQADATLGLTAGNRIAIRIKNRDITSKSQLPSGTIVKSTNTDAPGGYNTYTKSAFEDDGSLILVQNVSAARNTFELKITWIAGIETTYLVNIANATLAQA